MERIAPIEARIEVLSCKRTVGRANAGMRYQEYEPPKELAPWIKLFWVFESRSNDPAPETIVADGYPELIVHFRTPFSELDSSGRFVQQSAAVACGQLTKPLVLQSSRDVGMVGIRFQPSGMFPFTSSSMQPLTDARVSASELFADAEQLVEAVADARNDQQRVAACTRYLIRSFDVERENSSVRRALERIIDVRGCISVDSLATLAGISKRNLQLAFQKHVGISPKSYCRIARFHHLYEGVSEEANVNWIQVALDAGFFDQSHLIHDFRQFAGDAPSAFLTEQTAFARSVN